MGFRTRHILAQILSTQLLVWLNIAFNSRHLLLEKTVKNYNSSKTVCEEIEISEGLEDISLRKRCRGKTWLQPL